MRKTIFAIVALLMIGALAAPAFAQDEEVRLDLDFRNESLNQVLQMFRRGYGLEYTLGEGVDPDMSITTHLRGVTLDQALSSILQPNGLQAISQNGRYVIRERPEPKERDAESRDIPAQLAGGDRTPPAPERTIQDYEPRRGEADEEEGEDEEEEDRDEIMEVMYPMHLGADMASAIFGGGFVEAGGYYGGGSGGSSRGGSSFGSNRGGSSFGSNRGGSSFGSNRGGSSFGSNRGGSNW